MRFAIGAYESQSDGGLLRESSFGIKLFNEQLGCPINDKIKNTNICIPYYFVGDEEFPLHEHLLRPYGGTNLNRDQRILNYRLSRGRRCIENAFGILVARFRIFHRVINVYPETVDAIVKAAVCLYNFIKCNGGANIYCPKNYVDHYDKRGNSVPKDPALAIVRQLRRRLGSRNASKSVEQNRNLLKTYFNSAVGAVPWQDSVV